MTRFFCSAQISTSVLQTQVPVMQTLNVPTARDLTAAVVTQDSLETASLARVSGNKLLN